MIIPFLLIAVIIMGVLLLRKFPGRHKIVLSLLALVWTGFIFALGFELGRIGEVYGGNIAVQSMFQETNRALEDGQCDRVKAAYHDVNLLLQKNSVNNWSDAATLVREKLQSQSALPAVPVASDFTGFRRR